MQMDIMEVSQTASYLQVCLKIIKIVISNTIVKFQKVSSTFIKERILWQRK